MSIVIHSFTLMSPPPSRSSLFPYTTLFRSHNVREIAHSHAGAINLTLTSDKLVEIVGRAQRDHLKVACFVTGVDRKSTRLNSSHITTSYAVFCLKKKTLLYDIITIIMTTIH